MNYSGLRSALSTYTSRSDVANLDVLAIQNAEAFLFREMQAVELETEATGTTTDSAIAFPADYQSHRLLEISTPDGYKGLTYSPLSEETTVTAYPTTYTVRANEFKILQPVEDGTAYRLYYIAKLSALSDTNTTNWLLTNAQDLYLAASLAEVFAITRNTEQETKNRALVNALLTSTRSASERKRYPSSSRLQIKPRR